MLHKYLCRYPVALFVAACIVLLSLLPIPDMKVNVHVPLADKWTHMVMYGVLTFIIWVEYQRSHGRRNMLKLTFFAFLAPIAFGGLMELAQMYLTTCRSGEWLDFAADAIGVCIGAVGGLLMKRYTGVKVKR